jgi:hypothetical protein
MCECVLSHAVRCVDIVVSKLVLEREKINAQQLIMRRQTLGTLLPPSQTSLSPADT